MNYLFFDIECCNGKNICEFGYILTNEEFEIIEGDCFTINPENKFNLTGRSDGRDIHLFFEESVYYKSEKFPFFYERIKQLIERPNQLIVGHAIPNDAKFLNSACKRYNLESINFKFADSQKMFSEFSNIRRRISLESASEQLNVEPPKYLHKSDEDSIQTMNLVKNMCKFMECSLEELVDLCDSCPGKSENFVISLGDIERKLSRDYEKAKRNTKNVLKNNNYKMFLRFIDGVKPQGAIIKSELNGKLICICSNYENTHFKEMIALVQFLKNHGASYIMKASQSDIFVTYNEEGEEKISPRLNYVKEAIENGKNIEIITFDSLLNILGVTENDLLSFPFPEKESFVYREPRKKKINKNKKRNDEKIKNELGDYFKNSSIDLDKILDNSKKE